MIHDPVLRWVVTALFLVSAVECGWALLRGHRSKVSMISHGLHFVMAIAMAVMAWPWGLQVPNPMGAVFFLVAAGWFGWVAVTQANSPLARAQTGYHVLMMLAMSWMYAVMDGRILPGQQVTHAESVMPMPGMDMPAMQEHGSTASTWIDAVNWFWTVGFAVAAVYWAYRYFTEHRHQTVTDGDCGSFGAACQALMAAGMSIMFGVML